ncbi:hypothetical protein [Rubinisphaera margarita]|uniref:hypothetical protein n=1 Tax=Rubinisphaera margarita TaxID=2909586 RepID=UPI001EE8FB08|nr:hypothetical protein [Rubinisphaera margarita]MCG6157036.1 hypothetical protein [Rubinisphaera margarita]
MPDIPAEQKAKVPKRKPKRPVKTAEAVPRYQQECVCGKPIEGDRSDAVQFITCRNCQRRHFVLPISTYPEPRRIRKKYRRKKGEAPISQKLSGGLRRISRTLGLKTAAAGTALRTQIKYLLWQCWQALTPLRLTIVSIVLVIGIGGYLAVRSQQQSRAFGVLREATAAGEQALADERWAEATDHYQLAAQAVRELRRTDPFALDVLQKDRELQAVQGLCVLSLGDVVEEFGSSDTTMLDRETLFRLQLANRWLVVETWLSPPREGESVTQRIPLGKQTLEIVWPTQVLQPFGQTSDKLHLLLAGQIEALSRADDPRENVWRLVVVPNSAFLWSNPETCIPLGFELESEWMPDDSLRTVLERQQKLLGLEKP